MIKVMLIDDEPEIRKLLHKMVERQPDYQVVAEGGDFSQAVTDFARYKPDVVFMDIDLNGESGLECARVLTELNPRLKVIFATAHSEYMANAFEIYAFDYLVKPFAFEELMARIRCITRRPRRMTQDDQLTLGDLTYCLGENTLAGPEGSCSMSKREGALLEAFLRNSGQTLSRSLLLTRVWGIDSDVEEGNLDNYIHFLRRRLKAVGSSVHLRTVRGIGYRIEA